MLAAGWYLAIPVLGLAGAILVAHTGGDRLLGYGLKYPTSFQDTHLGVSDAARSPIARLRRARAFVNSKPKRPLMHRWPSVTVESIGEVTFTIVLSWTCRSTAQPTPQYGQIVEVTVWADSSQVPASRMSCSLLNMSAPVGQTPMQLPQ